MKKSDVAKILLEEGSREENGAFMVGECLFIRTVTYHCTGRVTAIKNCGAATFLVLEDAAWIASSARFMQTIKNGALEEVEPIDGPMRVHVSAIVDVFVWNHPLPRTQK